jgi:amino acid transporter
MLLLLKIFGFLMLYAFIGIFLYTLLSRRKNLVNATDADKFLAAMVCALWILAIPTILACSMAIHSAEKFYGISENLSNTILDAFEGKNSS